MVGLARIATAGFNAVNTLPEQTSSTAARGARRYLWPDFGVCFSGGFDWPPLALERGFVPYPQLTVRDMMGSVDAVGERNALCSR